MLDYSLDTDSHDVETAADFAFDRAIRHDFTAPGFALLRFADGMDSRSLRRFMVDLKRTLSNRYSRSCNQHLVYLSMGRFDQQTTTKFHLDGAPDVSFLMLGYEPTPVAAELAMADYSRAAFDLGITPKEFLRDHNPMYREGEQLLAPYVTRLTAFDPTAFQILFINNSSLPIDLSTKNPLGVMHQATVPRPDPALLRVVNSTMIAAVPLGDDGPLSPADEETFLSTDHVARRNY